MQLDWKIFVTSDKSSVVFWNLTGLDLQLRCQNQCNFRFLKKTVMFDYFWPMIFGPCYGVILWDSWKSIRKKSCNISQRSVCVFYSKSSDTLISSSLLTMTLSDAEHGFGLFTLVANAVNFFWRIFAMIDTGTVMYIRLAHDKKGLSDRALLLIFLLDITR